MAEAHGIGGAAGPDAADVRFLIERNADGIIVVDGDGLVRFANPAAEEAFGRSRADLLGAPIGVPVVAGETTEIAILRPGGSQIDAEMRVVATIWEGRPALLVSLRDISARKAMEDQLRQAQKMEAIGRLTAGVAHDFNNLLTVVMGNLATVLRESERGGGPRLRRAAANAMEGARRAATLTQRLLAFSRRQPLEPRRIDVNKLILGMTDLLRRTLGETIEVEPRLAEGVLGVLIDPNQLETAILNLAVNARDAMPDGGRLTIETRLRTDGQGSALPAGDCVEITVRDTGVGMPQEVLAQAFEPFFTTKDVGHGTGLGLSQVYGFVKQTGGDVRIDSAPGRGAAVTICLPWLGTADAPDEPAAEAPASAAVTAGAILVVDDDEDVRAYGAEALRELGYRVVLAHDGASALAALEAHPHIELLFTDVGLPGGMNGRELAEAARRRRPGLKVLLTTAYAGGALISGGRLDPGLQLLPKPYSYGGLAAKVRAVLAHDARPLRILVVEDEVLVRLTVVEALMDAGCRVEEAETASQAAARFRALGGEFDAAVIDIGLPDGRGDGLIEQFRRVRPDLPILLSTGYNDTRPRAPAAADRLGFLEKPFDGGGLCQALRRLGVPIG